MSLELQKAVSGYESYIEKYGYTYEVANAYHNAVFFAAEKESDLKEALKISVRAKEVINQFCINQYGGDIWKLEKYCFANDTSHELLDKYFQILKLDRKSVV